MSDALTTILDCLMKPGCDYNRSNKEFLGVAFAKKPNGTTSAIAASPALLVELENIPLVPEGEFFSYHSNQWVKYKYPNTVADLLGEMDSQLSAGFVTIPVANLINHIDDVAQRIVAFGSVKAIKAPDGEPQKPLHEVAKFRSRIVFSQSVLNEGEFALAFDEGRNAIVKGATKPIIASPVGRIPAEAIKPGVPYKCILNYENDESVFVDALEPHAKMRIGVVYSAAGFDPGFREDPSCYMSIVNSMIAMPVEDIVLTNKVEPPYAIIPPQHVDCAMLDTSLRIFAALGVKVIDISLSREPNATGGGRGFLVLRTRKTEAQEPQINILVGLLNTDFGPQRR